MLLGGYCEYWKAGLVVEDSNHNSRRSIEDFVSFREMITSQLLYLRGSSYETLFVLSSSNRSKQSELKRSKDPQYSLVFTVMNGNPSRVNIKQLCGRGSNTLSWKPVKEDQSIALQPHSSGVKIQDLMLNQQSHIQDESLFYQSLLQSLMYKLFLKGTLSTRLTINEIMSNKMLREIVSKLSSS
uniref:Uncharacterized protein n=1 Tax=Tanacetum cinerariifolium TaxID=118510 RepID=A0A6L2PAF1_TANCI|nr:hypothetical protein [Tanacetum cinerariifolium]